MSRVNWANDPDDIRAQLAWSEERHRDDVHNDGLTARCGNPDHWSSVVPNKPGQIHRHALWHTDPVEGCEGSWHWPPCNE